MSHEHLLHGGRTSDMSEVYNRAMALLNASDDDHPISLLANLSALLYESMEEVMWVGFYAVHEGELVLYPFQGPVACTRIAYRRGVCGTAWAEKRTIIVQDVEQFPGHIACSSLARSEIVVPLYDKSGNVKMVLDIDSASLSRFGEQERHYLEKLVSQLSQRLLRSSEFA